MHGTLSRDDTFNNMAAIGPDFKRNFVDNTPVSNADIARTLADILGLQFADQGDLRGRSVKESLVIGKNEADLGFAHQRMVSRPAANGKVTVLKFQRHGSQRYFDAACLLDWTKLGGNPDQNPCQ